MRGQARQVRAGESDVSGGYVVGEDSFRDMIYQQLDRHRLMEDNQHDFECWKSCLKNLWSVF